MAISTSAAKAKGRRFQQMVRDSIITLLKPYGCLPEDVKSTSMGVSGEDVQLSPFARTLLPISVECKAHSRFAVYTVYDQALSNTPKGSEPVVFLKADRRDPLVVLPYDYYFKLEEARVKNENS